MYNINNKEIDIEPIRSQLEKGHLLPVCQYIIDVSGCTLAQARAFYFDMIEKEHIVEPESAKAIRKYLQSELDENE